MVTATANVGVGAWDELFAPALRGLGGLWPEHAPAFESARRTASSSLTAGTARASNQDNYAHAAWSIVAPFAIGLGARALANGYTPRAIAVRLAAGTLLGALNSATLALHKGVYGERFLREVAVGAFGGALSLGFLEQGLETLLGAAAAPVFRCLVSGAAGGFIGATGTATLEGKNYSDILLAGLTGTLFGAGFSGVLSRLIHGRNTFCGDFSLTPLKEHVILFAKSLKPHHNPKRGIIPIYSSHGSPVDPNPPPNTTPDPSEVTAEHLHRTPIGVFALQHPQLTRGLLVGLGLRKPHSATSNGAFGESAFTVTQTGIHLAPKTFKKKGVGDAVVMAEMKGAYHDIKRQFIGLADGLGGHSDKGFHDAHAAHSVLLAMVEACVKRVGSGLGPLFNHEPTWEQIGTALARRADYVSQLGRRPKGGMGATAVFHLNEIEEGIEYAGEWRQVLRTVSGTAGDCRATSYLYEKGQLGKPLWDSPKQRRTVNLSDGRSREFITNSFYAETPKHINTPFSPSDAYITQSPLVEQFLLPKAGETGKAKVIQLLASDGLERALPESEIHLHLETGLRAGHSVEDIQTSLIAKAHTTTEVYRRLNALALTPDKQTAAALRKAVQPLVDRAWLSEDLQGLAHAIRTTDATHSASARLRTFIALFDERKLGSDDDLAVYLGAIDVDGRWLPTPPRSTRFPLHHWDNGWDDGPFPF